MTKLLDFSKAALVYTGLRSQHQYDNMVKNHLMHNRSDDVWTAVFSLCLP